MRVMHRAIGRARLAFLLLVIACTTGCDLEPDPPADPSFPWPDLTGVEPEVRDHLTTTRADLETALRVGAAPEQLGPAHGRAGMVYHAYSLRLAALAAYEVAERCAPTDPRWPYLRGHVLRTGPRMPDAVSAFQRAVDLDPTLLTGWVALGDALLELDRQPDARTAYHRALALDSDCAAAHGGIGRLLLEETQYELAVRSLEEALRIAPQASALRYPLGLAYRGLGNSERALEEMGRRGMLMAQPVDSLLQEVRELPAGWRVHLRRGTSFFQEGRYPDALVEFERASVAAPEVATVRLNLGSVLVKLDRRADALPHFEAAAQFDPDTSLPWFNLGVLAAGRGEDRLAVRYYARATDADAGLIDAHFNRANALRRLGEFQTAAQAYRAVLDREPGRTSARLGEALSLVRIGEPGSAIERLELAHGIDSAHRGVRNALARLHATSGDAGSAVRAVELARVLVEEESSLEHVETAAMAYAAIGRFDVALDLQRKAIEAARTAGRSDLLPALESTLGSYERGDPPIVPWPPDSPVLSPPPLSGTGAEPPVAPSGSPRGAPRSPAPSE